MNMPQNHESCIRCVAVPFCALILVFTVSCGHRPVIKPLQADSVIVAFGDSLTSGSGAEPGESYPVVLEQILKHKVVNAGVPGEASAAGLSRLPGVIDKYNPALVILCHGGNDLLQGENQNEIRKNLAAMIQLLKNSGADVIVIGVPKPGLILSVPEFYRKLAKKYNLPYEGRILKGILSDISMKSDQVHPNARGYRKLAESMAALIRRSESI